MRVALVTDGIWPYVLGGMQKHSFYICKYLAQKHVHVDLYHFNQSTYNIAQLEYFSEAEKEYIHPFIIDFPQGRSFPGAYIWRSYLHSKLVFEALRPRIPTYDYIYTKGFTGWYLLNQKHKGLQGCPPVAVKFHGYEMFQRPPSFKLWLQQLLLLRRPVKRLSRLADVVYSYGGKITGIIEELGVHKNKIAELPSGVEAQTISTVFRETQGTVRFLFLGRYERRKGIEEINAAILGLDEVCRKQCEFWFIGPIPAGKQLHLKGISYLGEIRDKVQLQEKIAACDVLLCPSWSEGMPNSILEAMAAGLTVLATDVGAVNVLVDEKTGWLLPHPDAASVRNTIRQIVNAGYPEINRRRLNAREKISQAFTWEKLVDDLIKQMHLAIGA